MLVLVLLFLSLQCSFFLHFATFSFLAGFALLLFPPFLLLYVPLLPVCLGVFACFKGGASVPMSVRCVNFGAICEGQVAPMS